MKGRKAVSWALSPDGSGEGDNTHRSSEMSERKIDYSYRDAGYWALPENVRSAIDMAKMKSKHSEFYYRL